MSKSSLNNCGEVLEIDYTMPEDGYVQALTVNESTNQMVWFDDIELTQEESLITQETQYDPWGLELSGIEKAGKPDDKFKYNGKELIDDLDLNWDDYRARMYDPQLGRMLSVDPMTEKYDAINSYNYCANSPILLTDPDGRDWGITLAEDGRIIITFTAAIINNSGRKFTSQQLESFRGQIVKDFNTIFGKKDKNDIAFSNSNEFKENEDGSHEAGLGTVGGMTIKINEKELIRMEIIEISHW